MSQKSPEMERSFIIKELKDNPNHPTNMYLTKGWDRLVDRSCVLLDGSCDCPLPVYDYCKYLKKEV